MLIPLINVCPLQYFLPSWYLQSSKVGGRRLVVKMRKGDECCACPLFTASPIGHNADCWAPLSTPYKGRRWIPRERQFAIICVPLSVSKSNAMISAAFETCKYNVPCNILYNLWYILNCNLPFVPRKLPKLLQTCHVWKAAAKKGARLQH